MGFRGSSPERIHLTVFDRTGRQVRQLLAGSRVSAGTFQVIWDGRDGTGAQLPAGTYFWKMQGDDGLVAQGTLVLLR